MPHKDSPGEVDQTDPRTEDGAHDERSQRQVAGSARLRAKVRREAAGFDFRALMDGGAGRPAPTPPNASSSAPPGSAVGATNAAGRPSAALPPPVTPRADIGYKARVVRDLMATLAMIVAVVAVILAAQKYLNRAPVEGQPTHADTAPAASATLPSEPLAPNRVASALPGHDLATHIHHGAQRRIMRTETTARSRGIFRPRHRVWTQRPVTARRTVTSRPAAAARPHASQAPSGSGASGFDKGIGKLIDRIQ